MTKYNNLLFSYQEQENDIKRRSFYLILIGCPHKFLILFLLTRLLILDDSAEDRGVYRRYLSKKAVPTYQIIESESGEEGLEKLELVQPDLILLDYLLPDFTGLEFIAELRAQTNQVPPIIMLTGQGNEVIAVEAMKSGVKDYLVKEKLTLEILTTSVKSVLQQEHWQFFA